jgi:hypothetical protein
MRFNIALAILAMMEANAATTRNKKNKDATVSITQQNGCFCFD